MRSAPRIAVVFTMAALALALSVAPGCLQGVLYLAPALVLLAFLVAGRYLGEETLARIAARRVPGRRASADRSRPRRPPMAAPRGTCLLARSLAERGPPPVVAL